MAVSPRRSFAPGLQEVAFLLRFREAAWVLDDAAAGGPVPEEPRPESLDRLRLAEGLAGGLVHVATAQAVRGQRRHAQVHHLVVAERGGVLAIAEISDLVVDPAIAAPRDLDHPAPVDPLQRADRLAVGARHDLDQGVAAIGEVPDQLAQELLRRLPGVRALVQQLVEGMLARRALVVAVLVGRAEPLENHARQRRDSAGEAGQHRLDDVELQAALGRHPELARKALALDRTPEARVHRVGRDDAQALARFAPCEGPRRRSRTKSRPC